MSCGIIIIIKKKGGKDGRRSPVARKNNAGIYMRVRVPARVGRVQASILPAPSNPVTQLATIMSACKRAVND